MCVSTQKYHTIEERRNHYDKKRKERKNFNYSRNVQRTG